MKLTRVILAGLLALTASIVFGQSVWSNPGTKIGLDQNLGAQTPMDAVFNDEQGRQIKFGDVFDGRPVVLMPIFYSCQLVCSVELSDMIGAAIQMKKSYPIGQKFDWVVVSINPKETPDLALAKEKELEEMYAQPASDHGFHLLTGSLENIRKVTDAIGFRFDYNPVTQVINHPSGVIVLTAQGQVSSYIYGANFPTRQLQDSINLAADGKVSQQKAEEILLGCIHVDPATGKRTIVVEQVMKVAGMFTVFVLGLCIFKMTRDARKEEARRGAPVV